jgi:hypothetical protein
LKGVLKKFVVVMFDKISRECKNILRQAEEEIGT